MQQRVFWKSCVVTGVILISLSISRAWSEPDATAADAKTYVQFGIANGSKGDINGAIAAFNQAIQIDPKFATAYYGRGHAYMLKKETAAAISDFDKAIELDPTIAAAFYDRGTMKGKSGDFDAAVSDFKKTIELEPKYAPAHYNVGHVDYFRGDLDGAIDQLTQALTLDANSDTGYFIRGLARHAQGRRSEAVSDFQKSMGLNFAYAAFWTWILQTESGQRGLARQNLSDAMTKPDLFKPDSWAVEVGTFLLDKKTAEQLIAESSLGDPADANDRLCEALFYAGMVRHFAGDSKGETDFFTRAVATGAKGSEEYIEATRMLAK